ncbi:putative serine/threonine-protein kinase iks1 [Arachnomyces sp. PD_36]|nr:putative serine/threonine-protein kinase iks1 [Arachnomyces sp. PD_36]
MAEESGQRSMSIVPYTSNNRDIVLRHDDAVVLLDRDSQQLVLSNNQDVDFANCPYCHRPMRDENRETGRENHHGSNGGVQSGFINPDYFRMLDNSQPAATPTENNTPFPSSRRRRLAQPFQPGTQSPTPPPSSGYAESASAAQGISAASFSQGYFQKFFVEEGELGKGGKGVVLLVKHVLDGVSLGHYACKRVPVGDDHEWLEKVLIEVQLLQHLSHQNLVSYRHVWLEDAKLSNFGPSVPCAFILQQYCNRGDLQNYIYGSAQSSTTAEQLKDRMRRRSKGQPEPPVNIEGPRTLQFDEIYSFFKDITSGLYFLHANGYIHRDLKPNNCLLHETGHELRVLVSDFGEVQSENSVRMSTGATGTVSYCAPEVLRREHPGGPFGNFTFKSDVFSLGMILYFLCFAQLPYRNADIIHEEREDLDQLRAEISQWTGFDDARRMRPELPEKLYFFLKRLLSVDPAKRPSADEILTGIQTGAGIADTGRRFSKNGGNGPELRANSRILPVDTPTPSSPTPRGQRSPNRSMRHSKGLSGSLSPRPHLRYGATETSTSPNLSEPPEEYRQTSRSPERDMVLHPTVFRTPDVSPTRIQHATHHTLHNNPHQHLLPPPPSSTFRFSFQHLTTSSWVRELIIGNRSFTRGAIAQVVSFLLKVFSLIQPCSPLAVNPWISYSLILLASVGMMVHSMRFHIATLVLHFLIVGSALRFGALCVWERGSGSNGGGDAASATPVAWLI